MRTIGLLACAKEKRSGKHKAGDLYLSNLFNLGKAYLEKHCDTWFILSAKHYLLDPETIIENYDVTLNNFKKPQRIEWTSQVWHDLKHLLKEKPVKVIIVAGKNYRENLETFLIDEDCQVEIPLNGLGIGQQMAWLKNHLSEND